MKLLMTSTRIASGLKTITEEYKSMFLFDEEYPENHIDRNELKEFIDFNLNSILDFDHNPLYMEEHVGIDLDEQIDEPFMALACRLNESLTNETLAILEECYFRLSILGNPKPGITKLAVINPRIMEVTISDQFKSDNCWIRF